MHCKSSSMYSIPRLLIALGIALLLSLPAAAAPFTQETKLTAADTVANDQFGYAVALRGDTLVVGARSEGDGATFYGAVYVFRHVNNNWTESAKLIAGDRGNNDWFGFAVAVNATEDTIVVGAPQDTDNGAASGSVYIFQEISGAWQQTAKLTANDGAANDQLGYAVAVAGNTIFTGAPFDDGTAIDSGAAYITTWDGATWPALTRLVPTDVAGNTRYGIALAADGDTAVIGAQRGTTGVSASGSAYVYRQNSGNWQWEAELTANDAASFDSFGVAVAIHGDTIAIGAPLNDDVGASSGSAYVFTRTGTAWSQQAKLLGGDVAAGFQYGSAIALFGDAVVVGAFNDNHAGTTSGSAYLHERNGTTWSETAKLTATDAQTDDRFGSAVAINAETATAGAYGEDAAGSGAGAVYLFGESNQPPLANPGGPYSALEGAALTVDGSASTDADNDPLTYAWDFGNGASAGGATASHTYLDEGVYALCLTVTDPGGLANTVCTDVTIANAAPTIAIAGPATVASSDSATYNATVSDPGILDTLTVLWDCDGDGFDDGVGVAVTCTFPNGPATVTIYGQVTDNGGESAVSSLAVTVNPPTNTMPTAHPGGPYGADEGATIVLDGTASSDPDDDPLSYTWSFGDGSTGSGPTPNHTYIDNGTYSICLTVTDPGSLTHMACTTATIANVAPTTDPISVDTNVIAVNNTIAATATFADPSAADTHTAQWSWGDGATEAGTVNETKGSGSVSGSHTYSTPGVYTIVLTVSDNDSAQSDEVSYMFVVVYDPTGGFVTGGGWFQSPAEACPDFCGGATGKAHFGFQAKYQNGASVPSGATQFRFKAGNLDFESSSYEWLVVAGPHAKYKGHGTINGGGDYQFMVTATDGQINGGGGVDGFRIKIWDSGGVIYDNKPGGSDDSNQTTAIGGGSIQIHKSGNGANSAQVGLGEPGPNHVILLPIVIR